MLSLLDDAPSPHLQLAAVAGRPDAWAAAPEPTRVHRFSIEAEAEADALCRVLNLLALNHALPLQLDARQRDGRLHVGLVQQGLSDHRAQVIAHKLRGLVAVHGVVLAGVEGADA